tara:strand:- start:112 stop:294 length:183 start_codon:yes stop_codon:yes gene_type:complete
MKIIIIMWIIYLHDLSSHKIIYDGSLHDCLHEALSFNFKNEDKAYSGCYAEIRQPNYLEE